MNTLQIDGETHLLAWDHAWMVYKRRKYPLHQVDIVDGEGFGKMYAVIDAKSQRLLCTIHLTARNLFEFLDFIEANQYAKQIKHTASTHTHYPKDVFAHPTILVSR